jgi:UDPglucose--hexose-1-phosphate uridylyltransferase
MESPVNELRTDWLTGRSVFIAENRALRPNEFSHGLQEGEAASGGGEIHRATSAKNCPFCAGNEARTPPAVYETRDKDDQWQVRVVPNMFPAVNFPDAWDSAKAVPGELPRDFAGPIAGPHEVIIESREHIGQLSELTRQQLREVLMCYAERLRYWQSDSGYRYGIVFKNQGPRAGASIAHLHSQLIALPFVPNAVAAEVRRAAESYAKHKVCPYCQVVAQEHPAGTRIVIERDGFIAICPRVSWQPYEVWIMPVDHQPSFERIESSALDRLSGVLHEVVRRLESAIPHAAYNMMLRTAPWADGGDNWAHWRIEFLPRINSFAGLEIGTGIHINPVPPERAAQALGAE